MWMLNWVSWSLAISHKLNQKWTLFINKCMMNKQPLTKLSLCYSKAMPQQMVRSWNFLMHLRISHLMETRPDLEMGTHRTPLQLGPMARESRQTCVGCQLALLLNLFLFSPLRTKLTEMKGYWYFDDEFAWWTANYLVDQWISAEPNNHQLYLRFLDALDM